MFSLIQPLIIKYNTFPIECLAKFDMAAFNINIKNMLNLFMYITILDQIGRDGGGQYMYPACKYVAVVVQEFDGVNC